MEKIKLTKDQVCVLIENETQLNHARRILEENGEEITNIETDFMFLEKEDNFLCYFKHKWYVFDSKSSVEIQIKLEELEEILKENK